MNYGLRMCRIIFGILAKVNILPESVRQNPRTRAIKFEDQLSFFLPETRVRFVLKRQENVEDEIFISRFI